MIDSKTSKKVIIGVFCAVVLISIVAAVIIKLKAPKPREEESAQNVMVSEAVFGPVEKYINTIGTLKPNDSVEIKSEINASIKDVLFEEGSIVQEGDLLVQMDESLARAEVMNAEALYKKAKTEYELLDKLAGKGAAAKIKKDQAFAEMQMSSAKLNSAKIQLEKCKILAPFGGMVGIKNISKGQFVQAGTELVKLVDCHPLKVDFTVAEVDIEHVFVSQEIKVSVGKDDEQSYDAKIIAIEPESDRMNHSFKVRAVLDVPEEVAMDSQTLKPGRFVKVQIAIDEGMQGILIPESAIEKVGNEDMLYIVSDGVAIRRLVTVGMKKDGQVEIITGVNEGDKVITKGLQGVSDGREVIIRDENSTQELVDAFKKYYKEKKK